MNPENLMTIALAIAGFLGAYMFGRSMKERGHWERERRELEARHDQSRKLFAQMRRLLKRIPGPDQEVAQIQIIGIIDELHVLDGPDEGLTWLRNDILSRMRPPHTSLKRM